MASNDNSSSSSSDTDSDSEQIRDSGYNSKLQAGKKPKKRSVMASDDSSSNSDTESDSEHTRDSGYNSDSSDAVAEYLKQRRAQHESTGPTLSDPCDSTRNMMRAERKRWKR